jgi:hypothetical protein
MPFDDFINDWETAQEIVEISLRVLNDRCGFDDWWENIGEELQIEIKQELENDILTFLRK